MQTHTSNDNTISVAADYSVKPGLGRRDDSDNSAEVFFDKVLGPALAQVWDTDKTITLDLDGVYGYTSSFLSEIGQQLIKNFPDKNRLQKKLHIKYQSEPYLIPYITREYDRYVAGTV